MPLAPGLTSEVQRVVTRDLTADVLGNPGVTVLATPFVLTLLGERGPRGDGAPPAAGGRLGRDRGGHEAPGRHPDRHDGAGEGGATRDRRALVSLRRAGLGRGGEDRGGTARALRGRGTRPLTPARPPTAT